MPRPAPPESRCDRCGRPADWLLEVTGKPLCTRCYTRIITRRMRDALRGVKHARIINLTTIPSASIIPWIEETTGADDVIILATADQLARLLLSFYATPDSECARKAEDILSQPGRKHYPLAKTSLAEFRLLHPEAEDLHSCQEVERLYAHLHRVTGESLPRSLARVYQHVTLGTPKPDTAARALENLMREAGETEREG